MKARPYTPADGAPTAGAVRRATARAFERYLEEGHDVSLQLAVGGGGLAAHLVAPTPPAELLTDELSRRVVPNRAQRRAYIKAALTASKKPRR